MKFSIQREVFLQPLSQVVGVVERRQTLPVLANFLLVAREINNVPFEELAKIMEQTSGALRTQIHRIKERVKMNFHTEKQYA